MEEVLEKIKLEEVRIERLRENHDLSKFDSYEKELVKFLNEDSLDNQNKKISVTYLWFYKNEIAAYISLLTDRINLEGNLKTYFRDKGILYKSLPALKIGRLCVDNKYLRRGIGRLLMNFTVSKSNEIYNSVAGCRFIVIDAKRNLDKSKDAIHFYKKLGFIPLKERDKGTTPMYFDLNRP